MVILGLFGKLSLIGGSEAIAVSISLETGWVYVQY